MPTVPNIQPDLFLPEYAYNAAAGRYINKSNGRFVGQQTIRQELDKVLDNITDEMVNLSKSFRSGLIDGKQFQIQSMNLIKRTHLVSAAMEKGGWNFLNNSDFGRIGQIVRGEYAYYNNLIKQIESGQQRLDGTLDSRMRLYGQAGRGTYHKFEREDRFSQGYDEERSILHGRDNCSSSKRPGCREEAAKGWQPIGTLAIIGSRTCLSNCRCSFSFRRSSTGETV
jgi:hypothetical protein